MWVSFIQKAKFWAKSWETFCQRLQ